MARVHDVSRSELGPDLADIDERFATGYGPFRNQVALLTHVPAALRHLMPDLMELRATDTLPKHCLACISQGAKRSRISPPRP